MKQRQELLHQPIKLEEAELKARHVGEIVRSEVVRVHEPHQDAKCLLVGHLQSACITHLTHVQEKRSDNEGEALGVANLLIIPKVSAVNSRHLQAVCLDDHEETLLTNTTALLKVFVLWKRPIQILDDRLFMRRRHLEERLVRLFQGRRL